MIEMNLSQIQENLLNGNKDLEYILHPIETRVIAYSQIYRKGEKVTKKVGEKVGENERKILDLISKDNTITYQELVDKLGISGKSIYMNIEKLKKKGLLKRIGPAKGGHWEIS